MKQYKQLLQDILDHGQRKNPARVRMPGTTSLFGYQMRFNLQDGFPAVTTKKLFWKGVVVELLWFLRGDTNIKYLNDNGVHFWDEDAYNYYFKRFSTNNIFPIDFDQFKKMVGQRSDQLIDYVFGDTGHQYSKLWRNLETIREVSLTEIDYHCVDQIKNVIQSLKINPEGRRHIVTAWNPFTLDDMALNACHAMFQFNCREIPIEQRDLFAKDGGYPYPINRGSDKDLHWFFDSVDVPKYYLDCQLYQRSGDVFLGVPLNIASYALLTHIIAKMCNMLVGEFIHTFGDVHLYDNHIDQVKQQLTREPYPLSRLHIVREVEDKLYNIDTSQLNQVIFSLKPQDFELINYKHHSKLEGKLSTGLK